MHRQDGRQEIDRRTLLAKGGAFAAFLVTGCARKESRGFAATSLRQLRARLERHIEPGFAPGMVGLVASGPKVETFVLGKVREVPSASFASARRFSQLSSSGVPESKELTSCSAVRCSGALIPAALIAPRALF